MKKLYIILLLAIICLSNAFAQSEQGVIPNDTHNEAIFTGNNPKGRSSHFNKQSACNNPITKHIGDAPKSLICLYDSIYYWSLDTSNDVWNVGYKTTNFVYDVHGNELNETDMNWSGSVWWTTEFYTFTYDANNNRTSETVKHYEKIISTYDGQNNLTSYIWQNWDTNSTSWVNYNRELFTYDIHNNRISTLSGQNWDTSSTSWVNSGSSYLSTYTYDANNNEISNLLQTWNGVSWDNYQLYTYSYSMSNERLTDLFQTWGGSNWRNYSIDNYTYDIHHNRICDSSQIWYTSTSSWDNSQKSTFTYDAHNNRISQLDQKWNSTAWVNSDINTYTYDVNNNITSSLYQTWNGTAWVNSNIDAYTYDPSNFKESYSYKGWDSAGTTFIWGDSAYYYFHTITGVYNFVEQQQESISIYPNPANDNLTIVAPQSAVIEITNIQG
ncbi:MAG: hypothetical protein ABR968_07175, partial [Bacteroidales bacterium]